MAPALLISNEEITTALKSSAVYVEPGTSGTTSQTQQYILDKLIKDDHIYVVILKDEMTQPEMASLVYNVSQSLGSENIVLIVSGNKYAAFSNVLPAGEADDLLERAMSVSTNNIETAVTFVNNVHNWQARHPKAEASVGVEKDSGSTNPALIITPIAVSIPLLISLVVYLFRRKKSAVDYVAIKSAPDPVKDQINKLTSLVRKINNHQLQTTLIQTVKDVDAYFKRNKQSKSKDSDDSITFTRHLKSMNDVLVRYLDVQENPRYYRNPEMLALEGKKAVLSFSEFVLDSVQADTQRELTEYTVDTKILQAQRYR